MRPAFVGRFDMVDEHAPYRPGVDYMHNRPRLHPR